MAAAMESGERPSQGISNPFSRDPALGHAMDATSAAACRHTYMNVITRQRDELTQTQPATHALVNTVLRTSTLSCRRLSQKYPYDASPFLF